MAASLHSIKSVVRAHNEQINGCAALSPSIDDAIVLLEAAHGVLAVTNEAGSENVLNDKIIAAAYRGVETLLEMGLRNMIQGHRDLIADCRR